MFHVSASSCGEIYDFAPDAVFMEYAKNGCPVDWGPDWTQAQLESALKYSGHLSAQKGDALDCQFCKNYHMGQH